MYHYEKIPNVPDFDVLSLKPLETATILQDRLKDAGFKQIKTGNIYHKWPPFWKVIKTIFGWKAFHLISRVYGTLNLFWTQTIGIGVK